MKTNFIRKPEASELIPQDEFVIEKVIKLSNNEFTSFIHNPLLDYDFIKENKDAYHDFEVYCRQIAFMIYNLDYILDLDVVVIGGGISEQPLLISTIQQEYIKLRNEYEEDEHMPQISDCYLHNDANLLGALYHCLKSTH